MNIALVTETYPPEINGVTMTLSQLVESLREREHQVQVIRPIQRGETRSLSRDEREVILHGVPIPNYPEVRFGLPCKSKLIRAWRRQKPDIVHVATEGPLGISAIRAARKLGIPCTSSFHTNFHSYCKHYSAEFMKPVVLAYLRWVHNQTRCTMAPTQELVYELSDENFHNTAVLGRGVDLAIFNPEQRNDALRRSWGAGPDSTVIVHVSRLAAEKNYELLLETYRRIAERRPESIFVVAGDGPLRDKLRTEFPSAVFTGAIDLDHRRDMAEIYASADVFIYPSTSETYGNVTTEAMACGNAVIAYDYAAARMHIKSGANGLAIPLDNEQALIEASLRLVGDKQLQNKLGLAAAETAKNFAWKPVIDAFEARLIDAARTI